MQAQRKKLQQIGLTPVLPAHSKILQEHKCVHIIIALSFSQPQTAVKGEGRFAQYILIKAALAKESDTCSQNKIRMKN